MAELCIRPRNGLAVLHAVQALSYVAAKDNAGKRAVIDAEVVRPLLQLCSTSDSFDVLAVATQTLGYIARHPRCQEQLLQAGAIPVLANLADSGHFEEPVVGNAKFVMDFLAQHAAGGEHPGTVRDGDAV